jgi:hypothetical protein
MSGHLSAEQEQEIGEIRLNFLRRAVGYMQEHIAQNNPDKVVTVALLELVADAVRAHTEYDYRQYSRRSRT